MIKKIWRIFFLVLIFSGIAIAQFSLMYSLPAYFNQISLVVIALLFTLFFFGLRTALAAALVMGFWLDLYSFNFFGMHLLLLALTVFFAHWILTSWLTNRSLYSFLLLIIVITSVYSFVAALFLYLFGTASSSFFLWRSFFWMSLFYQSLGSVLTGLLMFNLTAALTSRFQPFFLENR